MGLITKAIDPTTIVPNAGSNSAAWIIWHKALVDSYGNKKAANEDWLQAWNLRGSTSVSDNTLREYMKKQGISLIGIIVFIGLSIVGVQYAFLAGLLAAVAELIPFGFLFAMVPGTIFAYLDGGLYLAVVVFVFYIAVHYLESYIISPAIARRSTGVSSLVVILALLIGADLAGFWGLILAVPVAVCLFEYLSDLEKDKVTTTA